MSGIMDRLFARLGGGESISARLKTSFMILISMLLIPALVSMGMMVHYARAY